MLRTRHNFRRTTPMHAMSEINVTALLDMCFCLLIIFMISTPLVDVSAATQTIPLNLPTETAKQQPAKTDVEYQTISVDTVGRIYWGDKSVTLDELDALLDKAARAPKSPVIAIRADAQIPYQKVITILDRVQAHHLDQISLDTQADK